MGSVNFENSRIYVSYRGGVLSLAKLRSSGFGGHCGGHNRIDVVHEGVFSQKLRASSCMSFLVSRAKVLSNKRPVAFREVAMVDLFWIVWGWHALDIDLQFPHEESSKRNGQWSTPEAYTIRWGDSTIEWSRMLRSRSTFSSGAANHEQPG